MPYPLIWLQETDSTNRYLTQLCDEQGSSLAEMTTIAADFQTAGKGQRGNHWEAEPGENLLFSIVLYPTFLEAKNQFAISQLAALALKDTMEGFTPNISIKWSNDLYWKDCKMGGILIEHDLQGNMLKRSIIGIGLNINQETFHSDAPNPVSLRQITGHQYHRSPILDHFMEHLSFSYRNLQDKGEDYRQLLNERYNESLFRRLEWHRYVDEHGSFEALLLRTEPDGRLVLLDRENRERKYWFKEVSFVVNKRR